MSYGSWGGVIRILTPLTVTEEQLDEAVAVFREALRIYPSKLGRLEDLLPDNPLTRPIAEKMLKRFTT